MINPSASSLSTSRCVEQARQWVRAPWQAGPWDPDVAMACIQQTEHRVDATLAHRSAAWWQFVERSEWETFRAWRVAHHRMVQAWSAQDPPTLAQACVDWWQMTRKLAEIRDPNGGSLRG
ncbi:hypothetical protein [Sulfobacillus thermosulfidooxidans]|uniref:hypothetical protein n=1 Tax=Sulfobacillus thermosulfidooxidans TaxID=28034 RepID=UPI0006B5091E|nr:hypothetical protein [Sulfobacillus thermosulfidooxidans]